MNVTTLKIEQWGNKFIVMGEFESHTEIHRREFDSYIEALEELSKMVCREVLRRGSKINPNLGR